MLAAVFGMVGGMRCRRCRKSMRTVAIGRCDDSEDEGEGTRGPFAYDDNLAAAQTQGSKRKSWESRASHTTEHFGAACLAALNTSSFSTLVTLRQNRASIVVASHATAWQADQIEP